MQTDSKIISNNKVAKNYYLLRLEASSTFKDAQPGQFVHVRINNSCDPLLRRPFSIHDLSIVKSKSQKIICDILYEVKGKGTGLLSEKRNAELINILGPLGTGFDYQKQQAGGQVNIIIAGGAGVAPLFFLARKILGSKNNKKKSNTDRTIVLIGAATNYKILRENEFKDIGCEVNIATEDGTQGYKGRVTALFEKKILPQLDKLHKKQGKDILVNVYACGPKAMLREIAKICLIRKIPLQVSLEEFMGCGIGACLGCAIETKKGYKRVCHDGPVFDAQDIAWQF